MDAPPFVIIDGDKFKEDKIPKVCKEELITLAPSVVAFNTEVLLTLNAFPVETFTLPPTSNLFDDVGVAAIPTLLFVVPSTNNAFGVTDVPTFKSFDALALPKMSKFVVGVSLLIPTDESFWLTNRVGFVGTRFPAVKLLVTIAVSMVVELMLVILAVGDVMLPCTVKFWSIVTLE